MISLEQALLDMKILLNKLDIKPKHEKYFDEVLELIDFVGERLGAVIPDPMDLGFMDN